MVIQSVDGPEFQIDDNDYELIKAHRWHVRWNGRRQEVYTYIKVDSKKRKVSLQNFLMNPPAGMMVDHADSDLSNCHRSNLRICTLAQFRHHQPANRNNPYRTKGVYRCGDKFIAQLDIDGRMCNLGSFETVIEAVTARNEAAKKYHGDFAYIQTGWMYE